MKYDVFISYRQKSGIHQADALESKLKLKIQGCRIFLDRTEIRGENWKKKLSESIRESCNFVVIISKGCFPHKGEGTDFFLKEIDQALRLGKRVIPVYYDGMEYEDIKEYLSEIEGFHDQNHIIFNNNNTDGSVDQIIRFLKTEDDILRERYKSLSQERKDVRQEIMLQDSIESIVNCPVCNNRNSVIMTYCPVCGYKFFDKLEMSVADRSEQIQERGRLEKHKELWRGFQFDNSQSIKDLNQELEKTRNDLLKAENKCKELDGELREWKERVCIFASTAEQDSLVIQLNSKVSFKMIRVEGGSFLMGSPDKVPNTFSDEKPQHEVTLSDYFIGETQVTQALWRAVMDNNPSVFEGDNNPVDSVSWNDCQEFLKKLNSKTGQAFRLPTEAEWEYAARGGNKSRGFRFAGSDDIDEVAWYSPKSEEKTHPVKQKQANELGLYDMSGNVLEWCQDRYGRYGRDMETNPTDPSKVSYRVLRGGSWCNNAQFCRVATRFYGAPGGQDCHRGFRLALDSPNV